MGRVAETNLVGAREPSVDLSKVMDPDRFICQHNSIGANDLHPKETCSPSIVITKMTMLSPYCLLTGKYLGMG